MRAIKPDITVIIGDDQLCFVVWRHLFDAGLFVNPVISPGVPVGRALLRAATFREESRGAHTRSDFPVTRDEFRARIVLEG